MTYSIYKIRNDYWYIKADNKGFYIVKGESPKLLPKFKVTANKDIAKYIISTGVHICTILR